MRTSKYWITTSKEAPAEAELISHKLMLRAGLIKRLSSGIYTWMPLGLRVLRKVENIVRTELNNIGALELLMPSIQPSELWKESGRWDFYGKELLRIKDRHDRDFCYGPTHEEVITDVIRSEIKSYKQLPLTVYQIQTKFRDEVRPRFGVMRSREFIMKDAYSFHSDFDSLLNTYNDVYDAYCKIFNKIGLKFRPVAADTGSIGGDGSHEFQVLADSGEDVIVYSDSSEYAANIELAVCKREKTTREAIKSTSYEKFSTPTQKTCEDVTKLLGVDIINSVKSLVFDGVDGKPVLVLVRGDHQANEVKLGKIKELSQPLTFASHAVINDNFACAPGFIGPVGFNGTVIADHDVAVMTDFICGANQDCYHLKDVNFTRDIPEPIVYDIRNVVDGDTTPDGKGIIKLCRGIEVGHVFQLRSKYSHALNATYLDNNGKSHIMEMGCYGIGVSRVVGAAVEQNHDDKGIVFPASIAPFSVVIIPANYHKSETVKAVCDDLYQNLVTKGFDVLLDDRNERIGFLMSDSELIGIPYRIVVGDKNLVNNQIEFGTRQNGLNELVGISEIYNKLSQALQVE